MAVWTVYTIAFAGVLLQAWADRKTCPHWYLRGIMPLLYGGVVAWMFWDRDILLSLRIMICGSALPILLLLWVWWDGRREERKTHSAPEVGSAPK